jgi:hypothetical protein
MINNLEPRFYPERKYMLKELIEDMLQTMTGSKEEPDQTHSKDLQNSK